MYLHVRSSCCPVTTVYMYMFKCRHRPCNTCIPTICIHSSLYTTTLPLLFLPPSLPSLPLSFPSLPPSFSLLGGLIPLHNACSFGHTEVVSILLAHGSNPNARDNWNFTPLHEAAIKGKVDVCIGKFTRSCHCVKGSVGMCNSCLA